MIRRTLLVFLSIACLANHGCWFTRGGSAADDAATGAAIGGMLAGPSGAALGGAIAFALSAIARKIERGRLVARHQRQIAQITGVVRNPAVAAVAQALTDQAPSPPDEFPPSKEN